MPASPILMGLAGAGAGATAGVGSRAVGGPLSLLDAPRRSVAGALMGALGGVPGGVDEETGEQTPGREGSLLPALLGLGVGGASMLVPGLQPFAPYLGAGAAGLGQMVGEGLGMTSEFTPQETAQAMGLPDDAVTSALTGMATDPLTYLGALGGGKAGMAMNRPIAESPFLQAKNAAMRLLPEARGAGLPAAEAEQQLMARVLQDMATPRPGPMPTPSSLMGPSPLPPLEPSGLAPLMPPAGLAQGAPYKLVNPEVAQLAESMGWPSPLGRGGLPPFAQVRGGRVMPQGEMPTQADLRRMILENMQRMNATPPGA